MVTIITKQHDNIISFDFESQCSLDLTFNIIYVYVNKLSNQLSNSLKCKNAINVISALLVCNGKRFMFILAQILVVRNQ